MEALGTWFSLCIVVAILSVPFVFIGKAAQKRNRSGFGWILIAIVFTPVLAVLLLIAVGENDQPNY